MGKYEHPQEHSEYIKIDILNNIANELAELVEAQKMNTINTNHMARQMKEANRLKRLELSHRWILATSEAIENTTRIDDSELEDQA